MPGLAADTTPRGCGGASTFVPITEAGSCPGAMSQGKGPARQRAAQGGHLLPEAQNTDTLHVEEVSDSKWHEANSPPTDLQIPRNPNQTPGRIFLFLVEISKLILKFTQQGKESRIAQAIMEKNDRIRQ